MTLTGVIQVILLENQLYQTCLPGVDRSTHFHIAQDIWLTYLQEILQDTA
jgi:hypothetical protein